MQWINKSVLPSVLFILVSTYSVQSSAQLGEALKSGTLSGSFNLRAETVDQENALKDAQALTLSSKLSYTSGALNGFSAMVELEDVRPVFGIDRYSVGPSGFKPGQYSVIADPETTELDQAYIQHETESFTAKIGRQVLIYDNHRFVGHVGWRQDRQTFDALSLTFMPVDKLNVSYNFLDKRNRIFANDADIDSSDHLLHADYPTPLGSLTAYAYLLEADGNIDNSLDTYGLRLTGNTKIAGLDSSYAVEYATQDSKTAATNFEADYLLLEGGLTVKALTAKIGYEKLGSDNGAYGFSTPLSTLHAHNGWADLFLGTPAQGLRDIYLNVSGEISKLDWSVIYHDFAAIDAISTADNLGKELDLQLLYPLAENYSLGFKYAKYSAGDLSTAKPDTDKLWLWLTFKF